MARKVRKKPVRCPHCRQEQEEPVHAYSTYCRSCGQHFRIQGEPVMPRPKDAARQRGPSLLERVASKTIKRPPRKVYCYACSTSHETSAYTRQTLCPQCGTAIDLSDLVVDRPVTRRVDTRGDLTVTREGFLSNASSICRNALVEGKISGRLFCEGTLRLTSDARMTAEFIAKELLIEKQASCFLSTRVQVASLVVRGRLCADVVCSGNVRVEKRGYLEGSVLAKGITVQKGGWYAGELRIGAPAHPEAPEDHPPEQERESPTDHPQQPLNRWLREDT